MENEKKVKADEAVAYQILQAFQQAPLGTELNFFQLKEIAIIAAHLMRESHHPTSGERVFMEAVIRRLSAL